MRVAILTHYYPPEVGAAQSRLSGLAQRLVERGHTVFVLAPMPNYPHGRIFAGYGGVLRREEREGVQVIRTVIYPTIKLGPARFLSYLSFVCSSLLVGALALPRVDYLITQSPPLLLGISGLLLSRLKRARWVFNVSDLWPESGVRLGALKEGTALRAARALEGLCYQSAWLVTAQSQETLQNISARFPDIPAYHLAHGVDTSRFLPRNGSHAPPPLSWNEKTCLVMYAGLHGVAQGLDQVLDAATLLRDHHGLGFVLVGDGAEKGRLVRRANERALTNVRFLDPFPHQRVPALLAAADIALVPLKCAIPGAVPSKLFEAMAVGLPVVLAADGEAARILREARAGLVVAPGDVGGLVSALSALEADPAGRRRMGAQGREACLSRYSRQMILDSFIDTLERRI
jgi:glycosyltransferase involved in cell wall biosynthesis